MQFSAEILSIGIGVGTGIGVLGTGISLYVQWGFSQRKLIAYLLPIHNIRTIKLFTNREQIRLLNSKSTDFQTFLEPEIAYS